MKKHPIPKALSLWMKPLETQFLQQKEKILADSQSLFKPDSFLCNALSVKELTPHVGVGIKD